MRFFRKTKTAAARYETISNRFAPVDELDPTTWALLDLAISDLLARYGQDNVVVDDELAVQIWQVEVSRLIMDGYLLGRIEDQSEGQTLRFPDASSGRAHPAAQFALVVDGVITAGLEHGTFSGPPPSEIAALLDSFARQAITALVEYADDARTLGEALGRAVNLGREIALMEGFHLNPRHRDVIAKVRGSATESEAEALASSVARVSGSGSKEPSQWVVPLIEELRQTRRE